MVKQSIAFDPRNTAKFGGGAVKKECDLTQTADQYKQPHCVVVYCWGGGQVVEAVTMDREVAKTLNCMHEASRILTI